MLMFESTGTALFVFEVSCSRTKLLLLNGNTCIEIKHLRNTYSLIDTEHFEKDVLLI